MRPKTWGEVGLPQVERETAKEKPAKKKPAKEKEVVDYTWFFPVLKYALGFIFVVAIVLVVYNWLKDFDFESLDLFGSPFSATMFLCFGVLLVWAVFFGFRRHHYDW